ncbi:MAG: family intrarane metalloprotease [Rariglobus sp.]|nr:family intrarane metalloprotease [Rariglobus sp.]
MTAAGMYVMHLWLQDYQADRAGQPNPSALPGTTSVSAKACVIAALGAIVILAGETWGEIRLNLSDQQSKITVLFGCYTLIAAFVEELIFRGFIVVEGKGKFLRWAGMIGASVLFAALHPFLWNWDMGEVSGWEAVKVWQWSEWFTWQFTSKGWFSTIVVFVSSLWFYMVRFSGINPRHSLLPCIVAHAAKNLGVFAIKGVQGFVTAWW